MLLSFKVKYEGKNRILSLKKSLLKFHKIEKNKKQWEWEIKTKDEGKFAFEPLFVAAPNIAFKLSKP